MLVEGLAGGCTSSVGVGGLVVELPTAIGGEQLSQW